jgi:hypothetical protein
MPSKLGFHSFRAHPAALSLAQAGAPLAVLVDDFDLANLPGFPPGFRWIGQVSMADLDLPALQQQDPTIAAQAYFTRQLPDYIAQPNITYWLGLSAPYLPNVAAMNWYASFEQERVRLLHSIDKRAVIGNFGSGQPDWSLWPAFAPALQACQRYGGWLGLQEMATPFLWWGTGAYQADPDLNLGDYGEFTLRYRQLIDQVLAGQPFADLPIVITECGLGSAPGLDLEVTESAGHWQATQTWWQRWNGSSDPIADWRQPKRDPLRYYIAQLQWYDQALQRDPQVIGAAIFTLAAAANGTGLGYELAGTQFIDYLATYLTVQRQQPAAQPRQAPRTNVATQPVSVAAQTQPQKPARPNPADQTAPVVQVPEPPTPVTTTIPPPRATAPTLLPLQNSDFRAGTYCPNPQQAQVQIPVGWTFWQAHTATPTISGHDGSWVPPQAGALQIKDAKPIEQIAFQNNLTQVFAVHQQWQAVWFAIWQKTRSPYPNRLHRLSVQLLPDPTSHLDNAQNRQYVLHDPLLAEVWLWARFGRNRAERLFTFGKDVLPNRYNLLHLEFTPLQNPLIVGVEIRSRYHLPQNAWYLAQVVCAYES